MSWRQASSRVFRMLLVAAVAVAGGCSSGQEEERSAAAEIEFGIQVPDAHGELRFVATDRVPNVEDQAFGWRARVDDAGEPVKWIESLTLPAAPESWGGVAGNPYVVVSEDGRTSTMIGISPPVDGYVENLWYVTGGDPQGEYEVSVELSDGRKATFRFEVGKAAGARAYE